ncbi:hypothetical protein HanRHA438_Chr02g0061581 [Helianthus annuus]|nr:hypothetical protein HanRHA438_Chr02g0061581 [Helianthus annuus]
MPLCLTNYINYFLRKFHFLSFMFVLNFETCPLKVLVSIYVQKTHVLYHFMSFTPN